jgi:hypothetical protein
MDYMSRLVTQPLCTRLAAPYPHAPRPVPSTLYPVTV